MKAVAVGRDRFTIRIGGVAVAVESADPGLDLKAEGAAEDFLVQGSRPHARIQARWDDLEDGPPGEPVFDSGGLWRMYREEGTYSIRFTSPELGPGPYKTASFDRDFRSGMVSIRRGLFPAGKAVYPLEYPLDEILFTNILARGLGTEVHASGVAWCDGKGYLFVGQSGSGKTTLAGLWGGLDGAEVLSDDRIILRRSAGKVWLHGTPWHGTARLSSTRRAELAKVFLLRHSSRNECRPLGAAEAVSRLFAASFPPFQDPRGIDFYLRFFGMVAERVPCMDLGFLPDPSAVDFILKS